MRGDLRGNRSECNASEGKTHKEGGGRETVVSKGIGM